MSIATDLLVDLFDRVRQVSHRAIEGLSEQQLTARIDPEANTIAWLAWHIGRGQDRQLADAAGIGEVWTGEGFAARFGLPFDDSASGYGQTSDDVAAVKGVSAALYLDYIDAVFDAIAAYVAGLTPDDLAKVIDDKWDPPVTLAVRLVSMASDGLQHAGQASFIKGSLARS
ncbi:MAG: hypothetical protein JWN61_1912 [Pseudonocardiales bacterium]|nr:hypothetical protein [Jatrophihabitantaceae bacterium]MCW2603777.1 hypothetical protein [Pseudonocardiales bacterium]